MAKHSTPRRPALYARFSSDLQNAASCTDQLARLRKHLAGTGDTSTPLEFFDSAVSGSVWNARPGIQALLAAVKRREVSHVLAEDLDRVSRDTGDLAEFRKLLAFYDCKFLSVSDGMVLDGSSNSNLLFMMKSFTAEHSVKGTADKAQRGLRNNAKDRKTTGGRIYGYARTKISESPKGTAIRRNDVDDKQAAVVRRIFTMYAGGLGCGAIAEALNAERIEPPRSERRSGNQGWMSSCIREMLRNRRYIGDWSYGRREWSRDPETEKRVVRRLRDPNDPSRPQDAERFQAAHFPELAIIDEPLWERVQARVADHAARYKRREVSDRKSSYLFSGLLRCGTCGGLMLIAGGTRARYRCGANSKRGTSVCANSLSIREADVREALIAVMAKALSGPEALAFMQKRAESYLATEAQADTSSAATALAECAARLAKGEDRLRKLYLLAADGDDDPTLAKLRSDLKAETAKDRSRLAELKAEAAEQTAPEPPTAEQAAELARYVTELSFLNELDQNFDDPTPADVRVGECREVLRTFLKGHSIVLNPDPVSRAYEATVTMLPLNAMHKSSTAQLLTGPYDIRGCAGAN